MANIYRWLLQCKSALQIFTPTDTSSSVPCSLPLLHRETEGFSPLARCTGHVPDLWVRQQQPRIQKPTEGQTPSGDGENSSAIFLIPHPSACRHISKPDCTFHLPGRNISAFVSDEADKKQNIISGGERCDSSPKAIATKLPGIVWIYLMSAVTKMSSETQ